MKIRHAIIGTAVGVMCAIAFDHGYAASKQNSQLQWDDQVVVQEEDPTVYLNGTKLHVKGDEVELGLNNRTLLNLSATVNSWQTYWNGTNSWLQITNYMHTVAGVIPEFSIWEIRDGVATNIWSDLEKFDAFVRAYRSEMAQSKTQTVNQVMQQVNVALDSKADMAWSLYQSGTGLAAPSNTTWISTPRTVIAGGLEYQRNVDAAGEVWVLTCNGMVTQLAGDGVSGYFTITDDEGNSMFSIKKTSSYTVGANAASIKVYDNRVECEYNVVSAVHPTIFKSGDLVSDFADIDSTVTWGGSSGHWTASIPRLAAEVKAFYKATYVVEGETIIEQSVPTRMTNILLGDQKYSLSPVTISGHTVLGLTPVN